MNIFHQINGGRGAGISHTPEERGSSTGLDQPLQGLVFLLNVQEDKCTNKPVYPSPVYPITVDPLGLSADVALMIIRLLYPFMERWNFCFFIKLSLVFDVSVKY
jgi:hypothetical protein